MQQLKLMILLAPLLLLDSQSLARSFFDSPPTQVAIHNPKSTEGLPNRTTITLWFLIMQVIHWNQLFCGSCQTLIIGTGVDRSQLFIWVNIHFVGKERAAWPQLFFETDGELIIHQPGGPAWANVNVVFRGFNPDSSVYQWSTELMADGEDPVRYQSTCV